MSHISLTIPTAEQESKLLDQIADAWAAVLNENSPRKSIGSTSKVLVYSELTRNNIRLTCFAFFRHQYDHAS